MDIPISAVEKSKAQQKGFPNDLVRSFEAYI